MTRNIPRQLSPNLDPLQAFNAIRNAMPQFYERIPLATQATLQETVNTVLSQPDTRNTFVATMMNQLGLQRATKMMWENKLAPLKKGFLDWGSAIQDTFVGTLEAKRFDSDSVDTNILFGKHLPEIKPVFYEQNRQDFYVVTISDAQIRQAFFSPGGFNDLIDAILSAPMRSDQMDEYRLMVQLIREASSRDWLYPVHVDAITDAQTAKNVLIQARAWTERLTFPSRLYNPQHVETTSSTNGLVLFTTPEVKAELDVNALAAAFNLSYAETTTRIITIDDFGVDGMVALLCDDEFFQVWDTRLITTDVQNPMTLATNTFLHHWQILAIGQFTNAIEFTTNAVTPELDVNTWTNVEVTAPAAITIKRGEFVKIEGFTVTGTSSPTVGVEPPQGVSFAISAAGTDVDEMGALPLDNLTDVTPDGLLTIGFSEPNNELVVRAMSVYDREAVAAVAIHVTD